MNTWILGINSNCFYYFGGSTNNLKLMKTFLDFITSQISHLIQLSQQSKIASFDYSCRYCNVGGSAMMVLSTCLAKSQEWHKKTQEWEPKALPTHCHGHSLSLGVKDATNNCKFLSDTMNNTTETVKLIKYSPKRETLLGALKENLQYGNDENEGEVVTKDGSSSNLF